MHRSHRKKEKKMIGLLVLNILSYFVVIALSAMVHPGWLVLLIPAIWVSVGFRQVGEEKGLL